jgi:predicted O-methyltransferase YrrM
MSVEDSAVNQALFDYVAAHTRGEDEHLSALRAAAAEAGLPPISIGPAQGSLLSILLKLCGAREVVEVGTLGGYSATWMARALPESGRVRTIEASDKHADFAQRWLERSDVARKVEILRAAAPTCCRAWPRTPPTPRSWTPTSATTRSTSSSACASCAWAA